MTGAVTREAWLARFEDTRRAARPWELGVWVPGPVMDRVAAHQQCVDSRNGLRTRLTHDDLVSAAQYTVRRGAALDCPAGVAERSAAFIWRQYAQEVAA